MDRSLQNRVLSPSEVSCYRDCRQKWLYSYIERRPYKSTGDAQRIGLIVHAGLAAWYSGAEMSDCYGAIHGEAAKYPSENKFKAEEALKLAEGIFEHYVLFYDGDREKYRPIIIEKKIIEDRIGLKCIPDLFVQDVETGDFIVFDHKVQAALEIDKTFDVQKIALFKVLSEKYPLSGMVYNLIRRKLPMIPELTVKKDRLKKFTPSSTTEAIFRRVIKQQNLKLKDYPDITKYYKTAENDFFKRVPVRITQEEIDDFERNVGIVRDQMATGIIYPKRAWNCDARSCDFYQECYATNPKSRKVL